MLTTDEIVSTLLPKRSHRFALGQWGPHPVIDIYLRRAQRVRAGLAMQTLDLADVFIAETFRRMGLFSDTLRAVERAVPRLGLDAVFVECVVNEALAGALERRGYTRLVTRLGELAQADYLKLIP